MCTRFLGDMGADVIKIENAASGDDLRRFEPNLAGESVPFLWANRNKRGIALDLSREGATQIVLDLIQTADILVENFSTGVMERFGLGYEEVKRLNPRLVYCSVSAYGRDGELADRLGFDTVVQAETGFMSLNGFPDGPGLRTGPASWISRQASRQRSRCSGRSQRGLGRASAKGSRRACSMSAR
jgi:crotonobetainyl-CoA:carnitine CoA-transferase CaiB-like acyl-CoA transferase